MVCTRTAAAVEEAQQDVHALQVYTFTSHAGLWDPAKCPSSSASQQLVVYSWKECEDKCAVQVLQNTFPAPSNQKLRDSLTRAAWLSHQ